MKRLNLILLSFFLFAFNLNAQQLDVPQTQVPVIVKKTATWCPPCGGWGWDLFAGIIEDNQEDAFLFSAQFSSSDPLYSETAKEISSNFGSAPQPSFFYNGTNQNANSSNASTIRNQVRQKVLQDIQASPSVQSGILASHNGGKIEVFTKTNFFEGLEGEYYLGVYLVRKSVVANQSGQSPTTTHKYVLTKAFGDNSFGNLLDEGTIAANTEITGLVETNLDAYSLNNLLIATIIWKKEGDSYTVVNSNFTDDIGEGAIVAVQEAFEAVEFGIFPNLIREQAEVRFSLENPSDDLNIDLYNLNGVRIQNIYDGYFPGGAHSLEIDLAAIPAGSYFMRLQLKGQVLTQKIIVQ